MHGTCYPRLHSPGSSGLRVVQRKDIDGFYGRVAEADFGTMTSKQTKSTSSRHRWRSIGPREMITSTWNRHQVLLVESADYFTRHLFSFPRRVGMPSSTLCVALISVRRARRRASTAYPRGAWEREKEVNPHRLSILAPDSLRERFGCFGRCDRSRLEHLRCARRSGGLTSAKDCLRWRALETARRMPN